MSVKIYKKYLKNNGAADRNAETTSAQAPHAMYIAE